jgi:hypothetical protein
MILLANSQQEGLEGEALQEHSFCCSFLPALLAKTSSKRETVRGAADKRGQKTDIRVRPVRPRPDDPNPE